MQLLSNSWKRVQALALQSLLAIAIRIASVGVTYLFFVTVARTFAPEAFGSISFLVVAPLILVELATGGYLLLSQKTVPALHGTADARTFSLTCSHYVTRTLACSLLFGLALTVLNLGTMAAGRALFSGLECASLVVSTVLLAQIWLMAQIMRGIGALRGALLWSQFLWRLGLLLVAAVFFVTEAQALWMLLAAFALLLLVSLVAMLACLRRQDVRIGFRWSPVGEERSDILYFAMAQALAILMSQLDVFVGRAFLGAEQYSHYMAANRTATLLPFFLQVAMITIAPQLARLHAARDAGGAQQVLTLGALVSFVPAAGLALVALFSGHVVLGMFGRDFADAQLLLLILIMGQLVNCGSGLVSLALNQTGLHREYVGLQASLFGGAVILTCIGAYWHGAMGLAVAMVAVFLLWNGLAHRLLRRERGLDSSIFSVLPLLFGAVRRVRFAR